MTKDDQQDHNALNGESLLLLTQEVRYVKKDLEKLNANVETVLQHYVQREEVEARFDRLHTELDKRFDGVHLRIDTKADKLDLQEVDEALDKHLTEGNIKWGPVIQSVLTTVITAIVLSGIVLASQSGFIK